MGWNNPAMQLEGARAPAQRPAGSRRRAGVAAQARLAPTARPIERPAAVTPYAELHCHSHFSFLDGASSPAELVEEAVRLGLHALAITDHDGFYGAPMLAEAAAAYDLPTVFGAELSLGLTGPQNGVPDPEGSHLLVLARGVEGYHRLAAAMTDAHLRGDEKGRPVYDLDELGERGRGHWVVLTGCRKGAVRQALATRGRARRGRGARPADVAVRARARPRRALAASRCRRDQRLARPAGRRPRPRRRRGRQRPPRHPAAAPAGLGDGGRARPAQPGRARRLARPVGLGPPAQRRGDGRRAGGVPRRRRRPQRLARRRAGLRPAQGLARAAQAADPRGPHRRLVAAGARRARLRRALRRRPPRARGARAPRARAAGHRREGLRRLLRHRPRHRRLRPRARHPLPGPRLRGELRGLLRPRHHRGRRRLLPAAVRAVHLRAPRRGARHRRRLRLRPARGGHPVGLRHLRAPQRRPGGQRHRLPAADGGARRRQGARLLPRPAGRLVQADRRLEVRGGRRPGRPGRPRRPRARWWRSPRS